MDRHRGAAGVKHLREIGFVLVLASICTLVMSGGDVLLRPPPGVSPEFMARALALVSGLAAPAPESTVNPASESAPAERLAVSFQAAFLPIRGRAEGVYRARLRPELLLCEQEGNGMWGKIRLLVAFDDQSGCLADVSVIAQSETPGLGTRIAEPEFENRFVRLPATSGVRLATAAARIEAGEVSAITGATISCAAVVKTVQTALEKLKQ
ncbi:MAG TPA: FMN-binding protein [Candidatus Ozemobacteraceae bacterium]|nr:FMN-binding protein [Candidatus Ozemobacteraceae bacterium]